MICGLILAAGAGTRFGEQPKQLAELDGRPLLDHAIAAQCAVTELERIAVVLGAFAKQILSRVDFVRAEPVICDRWEDGQAASLRCGIEHLSADAHVNKVIVTLGDQPRMTPELISRFLGEPPATRAVYDGRPGHPVVLGPVQIARDRRPSRRRRRADAADRRQDDRMRTFELGAGRRHTRRPGGDTP